VYKTETDPFHVLVYKNNTVTSRSEWKELLTNAYIWYDWFSQPQPSRGNSKDEIERLSKNLTLALDSTSAYVERADTLMILAPSSVHADIIKPRTGKKAYTCYRTWRRRGFCVLEFFCANLSRRSTHPVLLVRSELDAPVWISPVESIKLAVGESEFTCCETNHLGPRGNSRMKCSRPNVKIVLSKLIDAKADHLFTTKHVVYGRVTRVLKHWWLRGIDNKGWMAPFLSSSQETLKHDMETWLQWDEKKDQSFFDREGVSLLAYAVCSSHFKAVMYLVKKINEDFKDNLKERQRHIESRISKDGFLHVGIPGSCTALTGAMAFSTPMMVKLLLDNGADPHATDVIGNNSLMQACILNRIDNVNYWLEKFPDWKLKTRNNTFGGVALTLAIYAGANRLALVKRLIELGANVSTITHYGGSVLFSACSNEDCDPDVVRFLLKSSCLNINLQIKARTTYWKIMYLVAKTAMRVLNTANGLLRSIAVDSGATALHYAAMRGDLEIVEMLLSEGADTSLKNDLGQDAAAMCTSFPELRGVLEKRDRKKKLRGATKKTKTVEVLGKRISTATPIQHEMWLTSLETLLMLYVYSCFLDFSLTLIYLKTYTHMHTGTEKVARVVSWTSIRS
jgi:hypothetical protein